MRIDVDTERQTITVNGVEIAVQVLLAISIPNKSKMYRFVRKGNVVTVTSHVSLTEYTPEGMIH